MSFYMIVLLKNSIKIHARTSDDKKNDKKYPKNHASDFPNKKGLNIYA